MKNKVIYIIMCIIIIAGIIIWKTSGFKLELDYSNRKQITISNNVGFEISDINNIVSEVLGDTRFGIKRVEIFGNSVEITAEEMTEEQKNQIVEKFNEKYYADAEDDDKIKADDIKIKEIAFTRIIDFIAPYILSAVISLVVITIYFAIRFNKIGLTEVILKTILLPVLTELTFFSILAITKVAVGIWAICIGIGLYLFIIMAITLCFEKRRKIYLDSLDKKND